MRFELDASELEDLVRGVVTEVLGAVDWPQGRLALTETEAAAALGVNRHVLRDLRLAGKLAGQRVGRRIVYQRSHLVNLLQGFQPAGSPMQRKRRTHLPDA